MKCNKLCELLKAASKLHSDYKVTSEYASKDYSIDNSIRDTAFKNGIIVHSDILLDYIKNKYPEFCFLNKTDEDLFPESQYP